MKIALILLILLTAFSLNALAQNFPHIILEGHTNGVNSVSFSQNGQVLASGSDDKTIRLWDVATGERKATLKGHTGNVYSVSFSSDGQTLASGGWDWTIRLWDTTTGRPMKTLTGHTGDVWSISFSPDGQTFASGSGDETIRLWGVGGERKTTLKRHAGSVNSVSFSPDGQTLASGSSDKIIHLWDVATGTHKNALTGHKAVVYSVSFSPDSQTLASGGRRGTIRLWDVDTGEHKDILEGHRGDVRSVVFSPDGQTLASGSADDTVRLWDVDTGQLRATLEGHRGDVRSVVFSPDGRTLAGGSGNGSGYLWHLSDINYISRVSITPALVESPAIGEQFSVNVSIIEGKNVGGYQLTVLFNEKVIRYVESADGDYLPGAFFVPPVVKENSVTLGSSALSGTGNGDGTLATLTFEVLDVKESNLILSGVTLTDNDGEHLLNNTFDSQIIEPIAVPSSEIVDITPSPVLSPAIGEQLVFNVNIAGGQNVTRYQLILRFDPTALKPTLVKSGDYLSPDPQKKRREDAPPTTPVISENSVTLEASSPAGAVNGDGTLGTVTFEVLSTIASTVSVSGHLIRSNGFRYIPIFKDARVIVALLGDVNRDGVVNVLDLVKVASSFGQQVPEEGNPADVNEDGIVNIVDLVIVAGAIDGGAAAPSAYPQALTMLNAADVKQWLSQAQQLNLTDATSQRGILFLEQLLAALTPKETALLANYPNPFNPETWIPYQLAEPADVTLTIYSVDGTVVRTLKLGYQPVGIYQDKGRAAYWDGKNGVGESVASGVYFYTLTAGDFTATRKMLIRK